MTVFHHDSDLLEDLLFRTAEFVCERCMEGSREISPVKEIHFSVQGLSCLTASIACGGWDEVDAWHGRRMMSIRMPVEWQVETGMTYHFAMIVVQLPADPYLAILAISKTMTSQILLYNWSLVITVTKSKFFCNVYTARRVKQQLGWITCKQIVWWIYVGRHLRMAVMKCRG